MQTFIQRRSRVRKALRFARSVRASRAYAAIRGADVGMEARRRRDARALSSAAPRRVDAVRFMDRLNIIAAVVAILMVVGLVAVRWVPIILGECRINPDPLPFNSRVRAVIEMQSGSPCRLLFNPSSVAVDELTLTRQPVGGAVTIHNGSILVYRPNAGFHGSDFFSFLARGTSIRRTSSALVDVSVSVR